MEKTRLNLNLKTSIYRIIGILGGLMIIIGAFLPWAEANVFDYSETMNGIEGTDGVIVLVLGIWIIIGSLINFKKPQSRAYGTGVLAVVALFLGVVEFTDIRDDVKQLESMFVEASVGEGVYMVIVGGILGLSAFMKNPDSHHK